MKFTETKLKGAFIIELDQLKDERGFFARSWCKKEMEDHGLNANVVQSNVSYNIEKGTLRGLHYQKDPYQETKLVRCTRGALYDVIIDLRKDSPTYMEWIGVELTAENYKMLYVPQDFGHGFITLEDQTEATYQVTQFYTPGAEGGIRWDDPAFNIEWPISPKVVSDKDQSHPDYQENVTI
ncbi:dTDP-4-dehydrorhamnose 3,5-epimerase [Fulvivirgaceae bacterium BMA10]|uniref:dTDP-4-dehydrorhamnose 3,5-epimerase n=1 Tax=Splendidivirga corallicola TaxID=3051826 RepID=A0ABT8KSZ3_9BACT|nr:dTDP-4-dehydrorhamnose 3,5-epimerase [Fulvivirgaceae bacterium BMA10]